MKNQKEKPGPKTLPIEQQKVPARLYLLPAQKRELDKRAALANQTTGNYVAAVLRL